MSRQTGSGKTWATKFVAAQSLCRLSTPTSSLAVPLIFRGTFYFLLQQSLVSADIFNISKYKKHHPSTGWCFRIVTTTVVVDVSSEGRPGHPLELTGSHYLLVPLGNARNPSHPHLLALAPSTQHQLEPAPKQTTRIR